MRIVDADALIANLAAINEGGKEYIRGIETAIGVIEEMEPEEAVRVVRCKDCSNYNKHDHKCAVWNHGVVAKDYCSRAERRELWLIG